MNEPELQVLAQGFAFLEAPRWRAGRLWAVDMYAGQVLTFDRRGQIDRSTSACSACPADG